MLRLAIDRPFTEPLLRAPSTGSAIDWPRRMRFRRNLRFRVALGFALLGAGVCLAMVVKLDLATDQLERRVLKDTMATEMQEAQEDFSLEPDCPLPATATIRNYVLPGSDPALVPAALHGLTSGFAEVGIGGRDYAVTVVDRDGRRFFVLYDKTAQSRHEHRTRLFLAIGIGIMRLLSAVGGRWLAGQVIAPVTELARRARRAPSRSRRSCAT